MQRHNLPLILAGTCRDILSPRRIKKVFRAHLHDDFVSSGCYKNQSQVIFFALEKTSVIMKM
jgi:hypothetical protein